MTTRAARFCSHARLSVAPGSNLSEASFYCCTIVPRRRRSTWTRKPLCPGSLVGRTTRLRRIFGLHRCSDRVAPSCPMIIDYTQTMTILMVKIVARRSFRVALNRGTRFTINARVNGNGTFHIHGYLEINTARIYGKQSQMNTIN